MLSLRNKLAVFTISVFWSVLIGSFAPYGFVLFGTTEAKGEVIATFVDDSFLTSSAATGGAEFDYATSSIFIDPAVTKWLAWNDTPQVTLTRPERPGEVFLGPGGIGVDDFVRLTVISPSQASLSIDLSQNDGLANSFGPQNVIFGAAVDAPDAFRDAGGFSDNTFFFDEEGSHNTIFTTAGDYEFQFSFRNVFATSAYHPDIWLLADIVPEPSALTLATCTLLALVGCGWRKRH